MRTTNVGSWTGGESEDGGESADRGPDGRGRGGLRARRRSRFSTAHGTGRFDAVPFREALSCSLELLGAPPLEESTDEDGRPVWTFPALDQRAATDPSWAATLDTLRVPRKTDQKLVDWRRVAPIRPVIFEDSGVLSEDTVHLHRSSESRSGCWRGSAPRGSSTTTFLGRASRRRRTPSRAWCCSAVSRCMAAGRNACTRS